MSDHTTHIISNDSSVLAPTTEEAKAFYPGGQYSIGGEIGCEAWVEYANNRVIIQGGYGEYDSERIVLDGKQALALRRLLDEEQSVLYHMIQRDIPS